MDPFSSNGDCLLVTSCHLCGFLHTITLTQVFLLHRSKHRWSIFLFHAYSPQDWHLNYFKSGILMVHITWVSEVKADMFQQCPSGWFRNPCDTKRAWEMQDSWKTSWHTIHHPCKVLREHFHHKAAAAEGSSQENRPLWKPRRRQSHGITEYTGLEGT